jgi:hypothetical protein
MEALREEGMTVEALQDRFPKTFIGERNAQTVGV